MMCARASGIFSHLGSDRGHGSVQRSTNTHVSKRMNIGPRPVFKHALRSDYEGAYNVV